MLKTLCSPSPQHSAWLFPTSSSKIFLEQHCLVKLVKKRKVLIICACITRHGTVRIRIITTDCIYWCNWCRRQWLTAGTCRATSHRNRYFSCCWYLHIYTFGVIPKMTVLCCGVATKGIAAVTPLCRVTTAGLTLLCGVATEDMVRATLPCGVFIEAVWILNPLGIITCGFSILANSKTRVFLFSC